MVVVCAWCKKVLRQKEPYADRKISHSICVDCRDVIRHEVTKVQGKESEMVKNEV